MAAGAGGEGGVSEAIIPIADIEVAAIDAVIEDGLSKLTWVELNDLFGRMERAGLDGHEHIKAVTGKTLFESGLIRRPRLEVDARDHFARQMDGRTEMGVAFGRVDVMMDSEVPNFRYAVEVEPYSSYANGVRQALAYAQMTESAPAVAVYGVLTARQARSLYTRLRGWATLFLLDGDWHRVTSAGMAEREWTGWMWMGRPAPSERQRWHDAMASRPQ